MTSKIHCVVGGQFGSEAKGAVAAFLSTQIPGPVVGVRVGGPNAGHTVYGKCPANPTDCNHPVDRNDPTMGHPWRLRQVPVLAVSRPDATLVIAQGSEVDIDVLTNEIHQLDSAGYNVSSRLLVDESATVITHEHKEFEADDKLTDRIGSTAKGIGAARAQRIMRRASTLNSVPEDNLERLGVQPAWLGDTAHYLNVKLRRGEVSVIIEGTQGYGLGLHTKYYPFTTSGDCRAIDLLAQCGLSPWGHGTPEVHVWVVVRPNPIRVAGNSGPLCDETTWAELGLPEEQTTVTRNTRRVGGWDPELVDEAIFANGGPSPNVHLVLSMVDHLVPDVKNQTEIKLPSVGRDVRIAIENLESSLPAGAKVQLIGTGPRTMIWYRQGGAYAATGGIKSIAQELNRALQDAARAVQWQIRGESTSTTPDLDVPTDELGRWWVERAIAEVKPMSDKALEYGGHGTAVDLIDIGTDLARLMGRDVISTEEATELGIYFYLKGKFSRWTAALLEGRQVSDDTLLDIGVYVRMVQRTREVGGWPYGPDDE